MQRLQDIAEAAKSSTENLERHVNTTNAAMAETMQQLQALTAMLSQQTTLLTTQVAKITSEVADIAAILKSLSCKIDNTETNKAAPEAKQPRIDVSASAGYGTVNRSMTPARCISPSVLINGDFNK